MLDFHIEVAQRVLITTYLWGDPGAGAGCALVCACLSTCMCMLEYSACV